MSSILGRPKPMPRPGESIPLSAIDGWWREVSYTHVGGTVAAGDTCVLRPSRTDDALEILPDIRPEDDQEWQAAVGGGLFWLANSINSSSEAWTLADKATDTPMVIFGVVPRAGQATDIWMVASVFGAWRASVAWHDVRHGGWIDEFWKRHPNVHCWSDARNEVHHRWLRWVGFTQGETRPWGHEGRDFIYFHRRQSP